ncbi:MAG: endonuclease/exonuclease/phosphatase family protein [Victivallaceae bacterium]|nr:endonuclease/exonuclease/phosphatase family protein [Victivallaceae bacterium]
MKLLIYNIAYGTGSPGSAAGRLLTSHRYLYTNQEYFNRIVEFISEVNPDVIGLLEADSGSFRTSQVHQAAKLAAQLNHFHICDNKYGLTSPGRMIPLLKNQTNAIVTAGNNHATRFHYFPRGFKKLIIEVTINGITMFLVHLSVRKKIRAQQLEFLTTIIPADKPVIIAGDFNTFGGSAELNKLITACRLYNPNTDNQPTYPSWKPRHQLDYLLCSKKLQVSSFIIPQVEFSDHLPIIAEISCR